MNKKVEKSWGTEQDVAHTKNYIIKKIRINNGSLNYKKFHDKSDRTVYVLNGTLLIDFSNNKEESNVMKLYSGQSWTMLPKTIYRLGAPQKESVEILVVLPTGKDDTFYLPSETRRLNDA